MTNFTSDSESTTWSEWKVKRESVTDHNKIRFEGMKREAGFGFFHICTDGTILPWMFKDKQDFIAGINRIGMCKIVSGVYVWAYTLMDNHVHFVCYGTVEMCKRFITRYKVLTSMWITEKYGQPKLLKDLPTSIIPIKSEEDLLATLAYLDRNAMVAGFRGLPQEYPWSSSGLLFKSSPSISTGTPLKSFSENKLRALLKTRIDIPGDWTIDSDGMLDPHDFTEWREVENLFKSPARYLYHLSMKLEGKINLEISQDQKSLIRDKELREITSSLCLQSFGESDVSRLNAENRLKIARILKRDYASSYKQISRMLHFDAEALKEFI